VFVEARRALLTALHALASQNSAIIVAGAQAIYLRTGDAGLAIAPFTTDGDLALDPSLLSDDPRLELAMRAAHFDLKTNPDGNVEPGIWLTEVTIRGNREVVPIDLIVPRGAGAQGSWRGARLGVHGNKAARRILGLEAALVDHSPMLIAALDPNDPRTITSEVAGPAALLVSTAHKLHDRVVATKTSRLHDKDAADVLRIMQTWPVASISSALSILLSDPIAGRPTRDALVYMKDLFGGRSRPGTTMAANALRVAMERDTVAVICTSYISQLEAVFDNVMGR
jgi:hypothetical protein